MSFKSIVILIVAVVLLLACISSCTDDGHAPGYGNTSKCTICGKTATHKTSNYGYCDKHWKDAIGG